MSKVVALRAFSGGRTWKLSYVLMTDDLSIAPAHRCRSRLKGGVSIEELAEDIARRGLLQSRNVRPMRDEQGEETGKYEVATGGPPPPLRFPHCEMPLAETTKHKAPK